MPGYFGTWLPHLHKVVVYEESLAGCQSALFDVLHLIVPALLQLSYGLPGEHGKVMYSVYDSMYKAYTSFTLMSGIKNW